MAKLNEEFLFILCIKYFNIYFIVCSLSDHLNKTTTNYFNGDQ